MLDRHAKKKINPVQGLLRQGTALAENPDQAFPDLGARKREPEDHTIAGADEANRYCEGTSYPENSDYILFAKEIDTKFGLRDKHVLEFCTGPGDLARIICGYGPKTVLAVDGSPEMIDWAACRHMRENLSFEKADIFHMDGSDNFYDLVVCQNALHHFNGSDVHRLFRTALDLLKPGGVFYLSDYRREAIDPEILTQRLAATHPSVRTDLMHTLNACYTRDELLARLADLTLEADIHVFFPEKEYDRLSRDPEFREIVATDPHPHYLDYELSLRVELVKLETA